MLPGAVPSLSLLTCHLLFLREACITDRLGSTAEQLCTCGALLPRVSVATLYSRTTSSSPWPIEYWCVGWYGSTLVRIQNCGETADLHFQSPLLFHPRQWFKSLHTMFAFGHPAVSVVLCFRATWNRPLFHCNEHTVYLPRMLKSEWKSGIWSPFLLSVAKTVPVCPRTRRASEKCRCTAREGKNGGASG